MKKDTNVQGNKPVPGGEMKDASKFFIIGIGASAGGVQALQKFFRAVSLDSGMAYVVILHLSPNHDSQLTEVLQHETELRVRKVDERTLIEPDTIYVVPPDHHLSMERDYIAVLPNMVMEDRRAPVDIFFRSLADHYGPRAISVILSGTGANGSMGLKRIKELGGATYVQNPREAEFNEMPRNAIATELIDEVLNVAEIPGRILTYRNGVFRNSVEQQVPGDDEQVQHIAMQEIFTQLKLRTGHDFSNYKRATLMRRIERRVNVHGLPDINSYVARLKESQEEIHALLKDLLISVTNFFRDRHAFEFLESAVVPALFAGKGAADEVRIWVAGCATGEEAYSIAMLCAEHLQRTFDAPTVKIFATDIDENAITFAREGLYTINDAADVSSGRLIQFFNREGDLHRVNKKIREMVLFASHNFIKDPPFSKIDLISCRNVLIYLNNLAQARVVESFHFALRAKGLLFLGTSESVDASTGMYTVFNREHHVFIAKEVTSSHYPLPEAVSRFAETSPSTTQPRTQNFTKGARVSFGDLHQKMLEEYAPPSVVINNAYDIVHMSEKAGKYFEFSGGEPTQNLLKLVSPQIRLELRAALYQALQFKGPIEIQRIKTTVAGQQELLDIHIRPALKEGDAAEGLILIIFKPAQQITSGPDLLVVESNEPVAQHLEQELIGIKGQLRDAIEFHEYQAEELKASNEELQAMNEELRSAAEELETSKEELQSINEELRTVNQELKVNVEETTLNSNNLQNLINSASVGTIFVDRGFAIRLFTPAVLEIFNLKTGDYGRPITDITHNLKFDGLIDMAQTVLDKLSILEQEVVTVDNRYYMMRLLPYRTAEDRIGGVVFTFFDITKRKASEIALRESEEQMRLLIEGVKDYAIFMIDLERQIKVWNSGAELMFGYTDTDVCGTSSDMIFSQEDRAKNLPAWEIGQCLENGTISSEHWYLRKDGSRFWGSGTTQPIRKEDGVVTGFVKIMRDMTQQMKLQEALKESEQRYLTQLERSVEERTLELHQSQKQYLTLVENTPDIVTRWDSSYRLLFANKAFAVISGVQVETNLGKNIYELEINQAMVIPNAQKLQQCFNLGKTVEHFSIVCRELGTTHFHSRLTPERNETGIIDSVLVVSSDITAIKSAEIELNEKRDLLQSILDNSSIAMSVLKAIRDESEELIDFEITLTNKELEKETGREDLLGKIYGEEYPGIKTSGLFELMKRVYLTGKGEGLEYYYPFDGFNKWYSCMFIKMGDGLLATNLDITDRKLFEQQRNRNYLLLQQSEEVAGTGTWDYDLETGEVSWSDGMYTLFELERNEEARISVYHQFANEEGIFTAESIIARIESGSEFEEFITLNVRGKTKMLKLTARLVSGTTGTPLRLLGVDMDITRASEAEARMKEMETKSQLEVFKAILSTQEEERRRTSESLHNGLGQLLYSIKLSISNITAETMDQDREQYQEAIKYTENLLTEAIRETRNISHKLMPADLEQFGLPPAINAICKQLDGEIKFNCEYSGLNKRLDSYLELAVFRTVQELMLNVVKHSGANTAKVIVAADKQLITIKVEDNGMGFPVLGEEKTGIGLVSIQNRIKLLQGSVQIKSRPGAGTAIKVQIPINKSEEDKA